MKKKPVDFLVLFFDTTQCSSYDAWRATQTLIQKSLCVSAEYSHFLLYTSQFLVISFYL